MPGWEKAEGDAKYHRYRIRDPNLFNPKTLRSTDFDGKLPEGVLVTRGQLKSNNEWATQNIMFNKGKWTLDRAKSWWNDHKDSLKKMSAEDTDFIEFLQTMEEVFGEDLHDKPTLTRFGEFVFEDIDFEGAIEIFRAGDYPQGSISETDLDLVVKNFDPNYYEPPMVKDHEERGPAFGWVKQVWKQGGSLWAKFKQIPEAIKEEIRQGLWRKISAAFYPDFEGRGLALAHVSLLGAKAPQVKGMKNFATHHGPYIAFAEFAATEEDKSAQKARSKKYGISILDDGNVTTPSRWSNVSDEQWADPVNYAYPCPNADQTRAALSYWGMPRNKGRYSSKDQGKISERLRSFAKKFKIESQILKHGEKEMTQEEIQKLLDQQKAEFSEQFKTFQALTDAKLKKLEEENADLKKKQDTTFSEAARKERADRIDRLTEQLLKDNRITPAFIDGGFKSFLMELPEDKAIKLSVDGAEKDVKLIDWAIELFSNKIKGVPVHFGEFAKPVTTPSSPTLGFTVRGDSEKIDGQSLDLHEKALAYQKEHKDTDYKTALLAVAPRPE